MKKINPAVLLAFQVFTLLVSGVYCLALSGHFFSPLQWPAGAMINIGWMFAWLLLLVCAILWFLLNKTCFLILLIGLAAGIAPLRNSFSVKTGGNFQVKKPDGAIRIMQWNCEDLGGNLLWYTDNNIGRKRAEEFIRQYRPDIICMQDYSDFSGRIYLSNEAFMRDTLGYPYRAFAQHSSQLLPYGIIRSGINIVSKYPITAQGILYYKNLTATEAILWADIVSDGKNLRIVTTHFRSFYVFGPSEFAENIPPGSLPDSAIIMEKNMLKKFFYFQRQHTQQAIQLRNFLDTCSVPVILAADLNTIPAAYLYTLVKGRMTDGFRGNATGLGATYNYLLPNIRIDYLMHHPSIELRQWKHFEDGFFNHDHLLGDYTPPAQN